MTHSKTIDGLRAYMAWWVVIGHGLELAGPIQWMPHQLYSLLTSANVPVYVFIVISGFVITHLLIGNSEEQYPIYLTRRGFRIFPVYLFTLFVMLLVHGSYVLVYTGPWRLDAEMHLARLAVEQTHFVLYMLLHLLLLHGIFPDNVLPYSSSAFLAPAWSLSLEWQFYLVAPLLIRLPARWRVWSLGILALVCAATFAASAGLHYQWTFPSNLFCALGFFALGILSRYRFQGVPWKKLWHYALVFLLMLAGLVYAQEWILLRGMAIGLVIWAIGLWMIRKENSGADSLGLVAKIGKSIFCSKFITSLGSWSYSTYLLHIPIYVIVISLFLKMGSGTPVERLRLSFLVSLPLVLLMSYLTYNYLERPGIKIGKKVASMLRSTPLARV